MRNDDAPLIGLMSGTSMDAVDAVLVRFEAGRPRTLARHALPLPAELRSALLGLAAPGHDELDRAAQLDNRVARLFAQAVRELLELGGLRAGQVRAIGSHGQTIRHAPSAAEPYTLQIGNPALLAELTGITVVADFRRRDLAAGGQGAPLAPAFHAAFFARDAADTAVINIGGIANLTHLPAGGGPVTGFDTGPGNLLLNAWTERYLGEPMDRDGAWSAGGEVNAALLDRLLADDYFSAPPPKSTGREHFHLDWLDAHCRALGRALPPRSVAATLVELSARTIADACHAHAPVADAWLICGGGVHNRLLMARLSALAGPVPVRSTAACGVDPDDLEALGFAWLAQRTLSGLPGNLPEVTGARGPRILGGIYPA
ncbi:anhydro-N-acetylmuramic acid kinase [Plasticicumulans sp.]|uniref:anhydro-N-acetylmuramic acid kinase n=1 Tax=Plasticicumulans sp. TaxID=2307179 RepID=UPI003945558B